MVPRLIICLYFKFLMTGSALNLALQLVVLRVELESVKHGVLRDALVEVSGTQNLFHWIGLKKLVYKYVCELQHSLCIMFRDTIPLPILDKNSPTVIGLTNNFTSSELVLIFVRSYLKSISIMAFGYDCLQIVNIYP